MYLSEINVIHGVIGNNLKGKMYKTISRNRIEELKNDQDALFNFFKNQTDNTIIYTLEKLGRLADNTVRSPLLFLMGNKNAKIRALSIKNLAKLNDIFLLHEFIKYASKDSSTEVKREAISAIGRLRDKRAIPTLIEFLSNEDPKIIMQAIRGLLVFSDIPEIRDELAHLTNHPNEIIKEVIRKELCVTDSQPIRKDAETEHPPFMQNTIVHGDAERILHYVPDESIHLTFTSPPYYNARDYAIYQSYEEYLQFLARIFKEVHRVTREGRFLILNTSPIIIPRISRAHSSRRYPIPYDIHPRLVAMGWEFIDDIIWVKPEASVKNRNAGFLQHRKPLAYKPNAITELLMVYRKKTDKLLDWNIKQYSSDKVEQSRVTEEYETTNVWYIDPTFDKVHSAVFPLALCNRVVKYYSFVGDLVFDPFAGSGTLGKAARGLGRSFFLTEAKAEYIARMKDHLPQKKNLFNEHEEMTFLDFDDFVELSGVMITHNDEGVAVHKTAS